MNRREFLHLLSAASAAGMALPLDPARAEQAAEALYDAAGFRQRVAAAHHRLPRAIAADLFPRAQRQSRRRRAWRASRRIWSARPS